MQSVVAVVDGSWLCRRYWSPVPALQPQALTCIAPPLAKTNCLRLSFSLCLAARPPNATIAGYVTASRASHMQHRGNCSAGVSAGCHMTTGLAVQILLYPGPLL